MTTMSTDPVIAEEDVAAAGALAGVRVLDFTWSVAGPTITTFLAAFGAEVIKVEWPGRPDMMRGVMVADDVPATMDSACFFAAVNPGKRGFSVDMRSAEGLRIVERLVGEVDMVAESFSAGVLESWGLGYERLVELNPDIVYLSMSGFGHTGDYSSYDTWGPTAQSYAGLTGLSGLPGRSPAGIGFSYLDVMAGYHGAVAALTALLHRRTTGEGQYVDIAQVETGIALTGAAFLDAGAHGQGPGELGYPPGNRSEWPGAGSARGLRGEVGAPYNCYPTRGGGACDHCAITVLTEGQWRALVEAMGSPTWAAERRYSTMDARLQNQDTLDARIAEWTRSRDKWELTEELQAVGVPAGAVQSFPEIVDADPQLAHRGFLVEAEHPLLGSRRWQSLAMQLSESPPEFVSRWPLLGADNAHVLGEVLDMSDAEVADLGASPTIWPPGTPSAIPLAGGL